MLHFAPKTHKLQVLVLEKQLLIKSLTNNLFVDTGDSGSLVVNKPTYYKCKAVGLLFARIFAEGSYHGVMNPINTVLNKLDITFI